MSQNSFFLFTGKFKRKKIFGLLKQRRKKDHWNFISNLNLTAISHNVQLSNSKQRAEKQKDLNIKTKSDETARKSSIPKSLANQYFNYHSTIISFLGVRFLPIHATHT